MGTTRAAATKDAAMTDPQPDSQPPTLDVAARAVLAELDIIRDHKRRSGGGHLIVHVDTHEALRAALGTTPEPPNPDPLTVIGREP